MRGLLIVLATLPHLYVAFIGLQAAGPSAFLVGLLLWSLLPVAIGAGLAYSRFCPQGMGWLVATLGGSLWAIWVGVVQPKGSTASLIFLFMPLWNMVAVGPAGVLLATIGRRLLPRAGGR
jgi:thiosulfate reductase cytochrome b subunit